MNFVVHLLNTNTEWESGQIWELECFKTESWMLPSHPLPFRFQLLGQI